jgi:hypothetical protein
MNIHFDRKPATASTYEAYNVRCDELPGESLGVIYPRDDGQFIYQTESYNPYARRRNRQSRRARLCDSLDAAKAAAVAYVTRKVKQARDEQNVRHGHGYYFKSRTVWFYVYEVNGETTSPMPARSKKDAKERLLTVPSWVTAPVNS